MSQPNDLVPSPLSMSMRKLPISILVTGLIAAAFLTSAATAQTARSEMTISGGTLPRPIKLSPLDATAFTQRINDPPELEVAPPVSGPVYEIESSYWSSIELDRDDSDDDLPLSPDVLYYQDGGFIQASQGDRPVWLAIDQRQRAIVDRYIRLGEQGVLSAAPSTLTVLAKAAASEQMTVQLGAQSLSPQLTELFWELAAGLPVTSPSPIKPELAAADAYWVIITLREGRSVQFLYDPAAQTLVNSFGDEQYAVSDALAELLATNRSAPQEIVNETGAGSPLWWVLMLGGGGAAITLALVLQRRIDRGSTS